MQEKLKAVVKPFFGLPGKHIYIFVFFNIKNFIRNKRYGDVSNPI